MQQEEHKVPESLSEVLDRALERISAGESVETCLAAYPEHASALAPLLCTGALLHAEAAAPLLPDMEEWLAQGAREFTAIAQQMLPQQAVEPRPVASSTRTS